MPPKKVVLITGCSKGGLGYALAAAFANAGCSVYATARSISSMVGLTHHGCTLLQLDVCNGAQRSSVVKQVITEASRLDVLVNNAGQLAKGFAMDVPIQAVQQLMEVNFTAVVAMTQLVAPYMIQQRGGTIVNIGSSSGYVYLPQAAAYSASKAALRFYTDALRVELAPFGVHVMHTALGFTRTQLFANMSPHVYQQTDSPYKQFRLAQHELYRNDVQSGVGAVAPSDPAAVAAGIVTQVMQRKRPARCYISGWLGWPLYLWGCWAPLWLQDLLQSLRLFGLTVLRQAHGST